MSFSYMIILTLKMNIKQDKIKTSYNLDDKSSFKLRQIVISTPISWKKVLKESQSGSSILALLDHQLLKNECALSIDKMNLQEIYSIIISSQVNISHLF